MDQTNWLQLVAMIMVLFLVLPGFLYYSRSAGLSGTMRNLAIWIIIGLVAALGYSLYHG